MADQSQSIIAKAIDLTSLIEYQPGSVVSRVIVKQKMGNVTLFAFDAGEGLSEHTAPFDAMVQVLEGTAEIRIDQQPMQVSAGQTVIMPANHPHALLAVTRFKMLLTMIRQ
jgi:quercetin dioxygenase-like cupin family protein